MNKLLLPLFLLFSASSTISHAYGYSSTPSSSANPPETIEQDQAIPINPNIYGPAKLLTQPQGKIITPNVPFPTPTPAPNANATSNQTSAITLQATSTLISMQNTTDANTNTSTSPSTETPITVTPTPNSDTGSNSIEGDTTHDPDPESDDVGTTPNQAS